MLPPTSTLPPTTSHLLQTTFRLPIEEIIVPQCRGCRGTPPVGVLDAALWVWYGGIVTDGKAVVLPHHPSSLSSSKTGWCKRYLYHPFLLLTASSFSSHTLKCRSPPSSHSKSPIAFFSISHKKESPCQPSHPPPPVSCPCPSCSSRRCLSYCRVGKRRCALMLTYFSYLESGKELAAPSYQMRQFLDTTAHCQSFIAGHPSRQKDKQLISVLDSVLTTLQGVGVGKSESR
jgi:hypothetical protein